MVKTIPSILQSVVATLPSIVKPVATAPNASTGVVSVDTVPKPTVQATNTLSLSHVSGFVPVVTNPVESAPTTIATPALSSGKIDSVAIFAPEDPGAEVPMDVDESSIDIGDDSGDNSNSSKDPNVTRASPYPMRVRNPPKL